MDPSHKQVMLHMIRMKTWAPNFITTVYLHILVLKHNDNEKERMNECLLYSYIPYSAGSHSENTQILFFVPFFFFFFFFLKKTMKPELSVISILSSISTLGTRSSESSLEEGFWKAHFLAQYQAPFSISYSENILFNPPQSCPSLAPVLHSGSSSH